MPLARVPIALPGAIFSLGETGGAIVQTNWPPAPGDIDLTAGNVFVILAADNTPFTWPAPVNVTPGQEFRIMTVNVSSGALGVFTPNAVYRLGSAVALPMPGFNRTRSLVAMGQPPVFREVGRTPTDVAN